MERIGLKDAIAALREELSEAVLAAANEKLRFQVGEISMEFKVEVERGVEGSAGIKFWVMELGAKGSLSSTHTHTLTIPLKPLNENMQPVLTGSSEVPE